LSIENLTFAQVLDALRAGLAERYLDDRRSRFRTLPGFSATRKARHANLLTHS
jgi:hypothetical protein